MLRRIRYQLALRSTKNTQKGFTLMEILIVMAILGGLMAWVIGNVVSGQSSAKRKETEARAAQIASSLVRFNADMGKYPDTKDGLNALVTNPGNARWAGPYLDEESLQDGWKHNFEYELSPKGPKIISAGADGEMGTGDDLAFINGKIVDSVVGESNDNKQ